MSKTVAEAPLTTREARKRLVAGLYWRSIDVDVHLGYRKGKRGGVWLVRWRAGKGYRQATLGIADDAIDADTLDYRTAIKRALDAVAIARVEAKALADGPVQTVRLAIEAYIEMRNARDSRRAGRAVRSDAARRLEKYVIGRELPKKERSANSSPLADIGLHELTEAHLVEWRKNLPDELKVTAVQRLVNDLKASLNAAYEKHRARLPASLSSIIKLGLRAEMPDEDESVPRARENQILSDEQVSELIAAAHQLDAEQNWEGDLFRLILVMAATGARFSQVARLKIVDVQAGVGRLMVPPSRKGRGVKSGLTPVAVGSDVLEALLPVLTGRPKDALLLERWRYVQQPGSIRWCKSSRGAWQTPGEIVRPWGEIRRRVGLPGVVPYSLRHSSIVRGIRANLPLRLVAAIHDTSVTMIERHYARYIADGLDVLAARAVVPLVPALSS